MNQIPMSVYHGYLHDKGTALLLAAIRTSPDVSATSIASQKPEYEVVVSPRLHRAITRLTDHPDVAFSLQRQGVHHGKRPRGGL